MINFCQLTSSLDYLLTIGVDVKVHCSVHKSYVQDWIN